MKSHLLTVRGKLLSINAERKVHALRRADYVREWRDSAGWEAKAARLPHFERVSIIAQPVQHHARLADAGNHLPSVKAIVDGLVDVGVLDGDGPEHVSALTLLAPVKVEGSGPDWITVELVEAQR
jgi:crossover junction endodeoxyribonuclease RusA